MLIEVGNIDAIYNRLNIIKSLFPRSIANKLEPLNKATSNQKDGWLRKIFTHIEIKN